MVPNFYILSVAPSRVYTCYNHNLPYKFIPEKASICGGAQVQSRLYPRDRIVFMAKVMLVNIY